VGIAGGGPTNRYSVHLKEMNLRTLSHDEASALLEGRSDTELIEVLDGKSRKLGDTAWGILIRRGCDDLVVAALRNRKVRSRDGKIRSLNFLLNRGRKLPESYEIFMTYCTDRSADVVGSALFGLALWGNREAIHFLQSIKSERDCEKIERAIRSLEQGDYRIYSPGFSDARGVWNSQGEHAEGGKASPATA